MQSLKRLMVCCGTGESGGGGGGGGGGYSYDIVVGEWESNTNMRGYAGPFNGAYGSISSTDFNGATIEAMEIEELGGEFFILLQVSGGSRPQSFIQSIEVEYDPGMTDTYLGSEAFRFGTDGYSTWWHWYNKPRGWTVADTGQTRTVTLT